MSSSLRAVFVGIGVTVFYARPTYSDEPKVDAAKQHEQSVKALESDLLQVRVRDRARELSTNMTLGTIDRVAGDRQLRDAGEAIALLEKGSIADYDKIGFAAKDLEYLRSDRSCITCFREIDGSPETATIAAIADKFRDPKNRPVSRVADQFFGSQLQVPHDLVDAFPSRTNWRDNTCVAIIYADGMAWGTAVHITGNVFVTAYHNLFDDQGIPKHDTVFIKAAIDVNGNYSLDRNQFQVNTRSVRSDASHDLSVLSVIISDGSRLPRDVFRDAVFRRAPSGVPPVMRCVAFGFPVRQETLIASVNCWLFDRNQDWTRSSGDSRRGDLLAVGNTFHGYSGGPLVDCVDGAVVGIIREQGGPDSDNNGKGLIVPARPENAFGIVSADRILPLARELFGNSATNELDGLWVRCP